MPSAPQQPLAHNGIVGGCYVNLQKVKVASVFSYVHALKSAMRSVVLHSSASKYQTVWPSTRVLLTEGRFVKEIPAPNLRKKWMETKLGDKEINERTASWKHPLPTRPFLKHWEPKQVKYVNVRKPRKKNWKSLCSCRWWSHRWRCCWFWWCYRLALVLAFCDSCWRYVVLRERRTKANAAKTGVKTRTAWEKQLCLLDCLSSLISIVKNIVHTMHRLRIQTANQSKEIINNLQPIH